MRRALHRLRSLLGLPGRPRPVEDFGRTFRLFEEVLDGNNRALEIITQMGEVLGGEYLFDVEYVRRARGELSRAVGRCLDVFGELTEGRYGRLREVAESIDGIIGRIVDEAPPPPAELVLPLGGVTPDRARAVGGKAAGLALLGSAAKVAVPEGFAVTTRAFDAFVHHNRIDEALRACPARLSDAPAVRAELQERVLRGEVPADLARALRDALREHRARCGGDRPLAVRSSAEHEDGDDSFAGQFETVLAVPPREEAVERAYRRVVASLFSERAVAYQEARGHDPRSAKMGVACLAMVDAAVSGVLYTSNPTGDPGTMVISAAWGLGPSVVEGRTDPDHLVVEKSGRGRIVEERIGRKATTVTAGEGGGTEERQTPEEQARARCLDPGQIERLVEVGSVIERHLRSPQDVEWAIDGAGRIFVLQARPLRIRRAAGAERAGDAPIAARPIPFRQRGVVVQEGAVAGAVHVLEGVRGVDDVPWGAVLVSRHDAPAIVRAMPRIAAIVTDTGGASSHMASLAREFLVPTVVGTGDATRVLADGQEVTVVASSEGAAVYPGRVAEALARGAEPSIRMEELHEFRRRRYVLRLIAPLNLVDPLRDDFTPEACLTLHDVLRFIHEKSVARLLEGAGARAGGPGAVRLELPVPAGIQVVDMGGGLERTGPRSPTLEDITSVPFRALASGMTHPGAWSSSAVPLTTGDLIAGILHAPDVVVAGDRLAGTNLAVITREYANVHLKFGYHFAVLDCYCGDTPRNNHVHFRFAGGATSITKRSRRLKLIATILEAQGFGVRVQGDLLLGRLANVERTEMIRILDQLGRLMAYTRQLDARLLDDHDVERFARRFMAGSYETG